MRAGIFAFLAFAAVMANARVLDLPWGPMKRLPSPDGTFVLYGKTGLNDPQLWIEETRTHRRTKLFEIARTLTAGWSADSSAFYVNDHSGSDEDQAYIYDGATMKRVDAGARIVADEPPVTHFDFCYRVSRTGAVKKLSQHTAPVKD